MASPRPLKKVKATLASEVCARFELRDEARPLLTPEATPRGFLETLELRGQYASALTFLAHALPSREAIWWGCLCLRQAAGELLPEKEAPAMKAVAEWVLEPTEDRRGAAAAIAEQQGVGTPAASLATAVAWTGGSLGPSDPKVPRVPPGPWLPAKAVSGAVLLASARAAPVSIAGLLQGFVQLGLDVAEGRVCWPDVKPKPLRRTWGR